MAKRQTVAERRAAEAEAHERDLRAALAFADADAKARMEAGWQAYEEARDAFDEAAQTHGWESDQGSGDAPAKAETAWMAARTALDVAVRRLVT